MGRRYEIDVLRPLGNQVLKKRPELLGIHGLPRGTAADGFVLTVFAAQGAATEEDRTAAPVSGESRFLPLVEHGLGNQRRGRAAAEAQLPVFPIGAALPGAEGAV